MSRIVIALLLAAGCAHAPPTDLRPIVLNKASFELSCAKEQLSLSELSSQDMGNMAGASVQKTFGVEGCGKRASYRAYCVKPMMMAETCDAQQSSAPTASPSTP
ncbi:MAG: hypothetical protein IV100_10595 [Myxococcales bacterium]|nr:hypothetical protein [Myxococcales bacterium]